MYKYQPKPIDTSAVVLSGDILAAAEALAEHIHDTWALGRLKEGWTYGVNRDDDKKTTPCLVAYDELPESEKEYDRATAFAAIKFLIAQGYNVKK